MFLDKSKASRVVDTLERKGYVARVEDPEDRRAVQVQATEAGVDLYERFRASLIAEEKAMISCLPPDVRQGALTLLRQLTRATQPSGKKSEASLTKSFHLPKGSQMHIRLAETGDAPAIAEIYNQGIEDRNSTFETQPRTATDIQPWVADMSLYPVLVVELDGAVVAWANLSSYRARSCYVGIADFSIYLHRDVRRRGIGKALLKALLSEAEARGFWKVLSRIFTFNEASLALCQSCGFRTIGVYEKHACLEGRWLDCAIVERVLPSNQPVLDDEAVEE